MKKVRICIPFYQDFKQEAGELLRSLARKGKEIKFRLIYQYEGYEFHVEPRRATQIFSGRNNLITDGEMLQPFDYFFFLDSDVIGDIDDVITLLKMDVDIAVAPYAKHGESHLFQTFENDDHGNFTYTYPVSTTGIKEVGSSGTGFMLIKREVFLTLDYEPYFFNPINEDKIVQGEDIYFCTKARRAGLKVVCNFDIKLVHKDRVEEDFNWNWTEEPDVNDFIPNEMAQNGIIKHLAKELALKKHRILELEKKIKSINT